MNLYILRHAIALDHADWKGPDSDRPLTKEGIRKMKKVAKGMHRMELKFDWILTSPYRRAYDTASIVAREFKAASKLKTLRALASDGDPKKLMQHLGRDYRTWESILLVGHEPYLSRLVAMLISGHTDTELTFKKGGLCALSASSLTYDRCARLEWLATPKMLRDLA